MNRRALLLALPTIPLVAGCKQQYYPEAPVLGNEVNGPLEQPIIEHMNHLADCVFHEARGEPVEGWDAVVEVILNRVADKRWPNSIPEVIYQPYQFSWTEFSVREAQRRVRSDANTYQRILTHLENYEHSGIISGANHYHATYINPPWADKMEKIAVIGNHVFYKA